MENRMSAVLFAVSAGRPLKKRNTGLAPLYKNNADEACGACGTHLKKKPVSLKAFNFREPLSERKGHNNEERRNKRTGFAGT